MNNNNLPPAWTETDSTLYRKIAPVAVPARAEQLATLLSLLPFQADDSFRAVEIGSGEGFLVGALLACFPYATVIALDGSTEMRSTICQRLTQFDGRWQVQPFELPTDNWHRHLQNTDAVLSSLCLHHLTGLKKARLFETIYRSMSPRGALLIADLIEPQRPEANALYAATWDRSARQQAIEQTGSIDLFEQFQHNKWNLFRYPDPVDKPSPLFHQLQWLKQAGFTGVDCFWLQAGHAIYGGYKNNASPPKQSLSFETALATVQAELSRS